MDRIIRVINRIVHRILYFYIYKGTSVILYGVPRYICPKNVQFGSSVRINDRVLFHAKEKIIIGNNVTFSYGSTLLTESYVVDNFNLYLKRKHKAKPIIIGDNVWIGANATILPGVSIANNIIVGAGSVVTHNLDEENFIYAGNPAKKIRKLR